MRIPDLRIICLSWLLFISGCLHAQNILTDNDINAYSIYDRMIVLTGGGPVQLHSTLRPFWRNDVVALADSFSLVDFSAIGLAQLQRIYDENNEFTDKETISQKSLWHTFYKTPYHFYEVDVPDFYLRIDPVVNIALGRETEEGVNTFANQRGLKIRGGIGKSVYFETGLYDSQVRFPNYINQYVDTFGVLPGGTLFKNFNSKFFDFTQGRDYLLATAYVGVNLGKYIGIQLGHNQCFIGDGIRSLLLSDFAAPYFSLKINTRIWKFHYQNIFAELAADNFVDASSKLMVVPKKYMAAHYLSFKPSPTYSVGLFEAVIFNRENHQFELQYLNPIILYRTIEGGLGSPDNVMLGLNSRLDLWRKISVYGQFMLDDISIADILNGHLDWWGNKFGYQLGGKWFNAFTFEHFDLQAEWNSVRPYTYSHYNSNSNYSHYKQALAHPLGANFNELILSGTYYVSPRFSLKSSVYLINKGEDQDSFSYGGNIILPNTLRPGDFGHTIGQGAGATIFYWSSHINYEVVPGVVLDLMYLFRNKKGDLDGQKLNTNLIQFSARYNLPYREEAF